MEVSVRQTESTIRLAYDAYKISYIYARVTSKKLFTI